MWFEEMGQRNDICLTCCARAREKGAGFRDAPGSSNRRLGKWYQEGGELYPFLCACVGPLAPSLSRPVLCGRSGACRLNITSRVSAAANKQAGQARRCAESGQKTQITIQKTPTNRRQRRTIHD